MIRRDRRLTALSYDSPGSSSGDRRTGRPSWLRCEEWAGRGELVIAGALGDPPRGALFGFAVDDPTRVEEFVAADPYVAAGLVIAHRIEPWNVVAHRPLEG